MNIIKKLLASVSVFTLLATNAVFAEEIDLSDIELMPELGMEEEELEELIEAFLEEEEEKALESEFRFYDVPAPSTYFEPVMYLYDKGVISGYDGYYSGYYLPWNWVNRAEMMKIIVEAAASRIAGEEGAEALLAEYEDENCFADVSAGEWYTKYICFAEEMDWVDGYDDGTFKPGQYVTFVEALKITYMGFDIRYEETEGLWYKNAIARAYQYIYIPETVGTNYEKHLNRGEMAYLIRMALVFDPDAVSDLATWDFASWVEVNF